MAYNVSVTCSYLLSLGSKKICNKVETRHDHRLLYYLLIHFLRFNVLNVSSFKRPLARDQLSSLLFGQSKYVRCRYMDGICTGVMNSKTSVSV